MPKLLSRRSRKLSSYNKHVGACIKRGLSMKEAAALWHKKHAASKRLVSSKRVSKVSSRRSGVRRCSMARVKSCHLKKKVCQLSKKGRAVCRKSRA